MPLLQQKHASMPLSLDNPETPRLYRDVFPYRQISRIEFDDTFVLPRPADPMFITDTTFRDGQQSMEPFSADQIVELFKLLSRLSGPKGIVRQTEFFIYSKKDREALDRCRELGLRYPEITSWIRATPEDFRLVHEMGIPETGILVSCSDYHIFKKLHMTRRQALDTYLATVKEAFSAGVIPRCHLEDITRADFYGFVEIGRAHV